MECWLCMCVTLVMGVTYICVRKPEHYTSNDGLSSDRRYAIIWTNDGMLLIGSSGTLRSEIWVQIQSMLHEQMNCEMSSAKWRPLFPFSVCWWPYHNVNLQLPNHVQAEPHSRDTFLRRYQLCISNYTLHIVSENNKSISNIQWWSLGMDI